MRRGRARVSCVSFSRRCPPVLSLFSVPRAIVRCVTTLRILWCGRWRSLGSPVPLPVPRACRTPLGFGDTGLLHLHSVLWHPPQPGGPHLVRAVRQPGRVEAEGGQGEPQSPAGHALTQTQRLTDPLPRCLLLLFGAQAMRKWGNKRVNEYWEANVPEKYRIPDENDPVQEVERFIRDK